MPVFRSIGATGTAGFPRRSSERCKLRQMSREWTRPVGPQNRAAGCELWLDRMTSGCADHAGCRLCRHIRRSKAMQASTSPGQSAARGSDAERRASKGRSKKRNLPCGRQGDRNKSQRQDEEQRQTQQIRRSTRCPSERKRGKRTDLLSLGVLVRSLCIHRNGDLSHRVFTQRIVAHFDRQIFRPLPDHIAGRDDQFHAKRCKHQNNGHCPVTGEQGADDTHDGRICHLYCAVISKARSDRRGHANAARAPVTSLRTSPLRSRHPREQW